MLITLTRWVYFSYTNTLMDKSLTKTFTDYDVTWCKLVGGGDFLLSLLWAFTDSWNLWDNESKYYSIVYG